MAKGIKRKRGVTLVSDSYTLKQTHRRIYTVNTLSCWLRRRPFFAFQPWHHIIYV